MADIRLLKIRISPDLTLGDFDSLGYVPDELNIKTFQVEKIIQIQ